MTETPQVEAFMAAKQDAVLDRAIVSLEVAEPDQVRPEIHRVLGTLGTYGVADAVELLRPLEERLTRDPDGVAAIEDVRGNALTGLREIQHRREGDQS